MTASMLLEVENMRFWQPRFVSFEPYPYISYVLFMFKPKFYDI